VTDQRKCPGCGGPNERPLAECCSPLCTDRMRARRKAGLEPSENPLSELGRVAGLRGAEARRRLKDGV
jgi:hypothetical protein